MGRKLKRFERGADKMKELPDGILSLAGIDVYLSDSQVVYEQKEFTEDILRSDFDIKSGGWYVEDGWVVGKNPDRCPGMIVSKANYFGNVLLEATVKLVEPSTHDINVMINGEWDEEKDCRGLAYVTGLEAFWHGNIGFEKSPEYKLIVATSMLDFDPNKAYHLQFGNVCGRLFVVVGGRLGLEINDPDPIDNMKYGKIGFEAFASWWKFKDVKVKTLKYEKIDERYISEF